MCGILGVINIDQKPDASIERKLKAIELLAHRGPDNEGKWVNGSSTVGLAHRRLSIIDLSSHADQPMTGANNTALVFNGEIYNHRDIRKSLSEDWSFKTSSDTETILASYAKYGFDAVQYLTGMFAFALWDENNKRLFCARDRFGIKPFYYTVVKNQLIFASEIKALLPFLHQIDTNYEALAEYLTFQYTIGEETLFKDIKELKPGHSLVVENGRVSIQKYWDVEYCIDHSHSVSYFEEKLRDLLDQSINRHLVSDVPIGSYLSGGVDSSLVTVLAAERDRQFYGSFHGKFTEFPGYDESEYARATTNELDSSLYEIDISSDDFSRHIKDVIYHLDVPVAGPGSFPQFMVSRLASEHVKVVLGGQGGDEMFGGYARYLIAYFEQTIKAAIEGTYKNGNFVVTPESIIPNLTLLQEYKPLLKSFWQEGVFDPLDDRYFRLIDRSLNIKDEINWHLLGKEHVVQRFKAIFNNQDNVRHDAYFDKMTHFDFKCLLPALLHVEDRMSMAHGLESRVPLLDHNIVEFAATIPADVKFPGGKMKHMLKGTFERNIPDKILTRRDKMGFPVPLKEWFEGALNSFVHDMFSSQRSRERDIYNADVILETLHSGNKYSRKAWGLLSLELWQQSFHDQHSSFKQVIS